MRLLFMGSVVQSTANRLLTHADPCDQQRAVGVLLRGTHLHRPFGLLETWISVETSNRASRSLRLQLLPYPVGHGSTCTGGMKT